LSAFLGSLVALYTPGGLTEEDLCRAVRERDVYVDEFSLTLQDKCGATTKIPAIVTIRVEDKVPPKIVYPAQNRTVECDGQGNTAELSAWLASHGGAWAFDNCCDVTWTNDYSPENFVYTCGKAGSVTVTFTATDCAGNSSPTTATFQIVDIKKPWWDQPMPGDLVVECDQVPKPPPVRALDICDPEVEGSFQEIRWPFPWLLELLWNTVAGEGSKTHLGRAVNLAKKKYTRRNLGRRLG